MPMMTVFEPLFILLFLTAVVTLLVAAASAFSGRRSRAVSLLRRLTIGAAVYFTIVVIVAAASTPHVYHIGEPHCFDDWCITVADAKRALTDSAQTWSVTLRISSRAQRVAQRENGATVYLTDSLHRRFDVAPGTPVMPLSAQLQPGESIESVRLYRVPLDARGVGLVFTHQGVFPISDFIIGENEWFHKTVVTFDQPGHTLLGIARSAVAQPAE
jgi:hypothetical protein